MADVGHFGCPKFTFDRISDHFRSICNFNFFEFFLTKWLPAAILDVRKSRLILFLSISHRYATFIFFEIFDKMADVGHFGCLKITLDCIKWFSMSKIHFRWHFWPFQIHTELYLLFKIFDKMAAGGHFGCPQITFDRIAGYFFFWQNGRRRPFWMGRQCQLSNSSEIFGWVMHVSSLKNVV